MLASEQFFCRLEQIGISAPQGCGKTTIVYSLEFLFNSLGRLVSMDAYALQIS